MADLLRRWYDRREPEEVCREAWRRREMNESYNPNELYDVVIKFDGSSIEVTSCVDAKIDKAFVCYYTPEGKYIEEEVSVPGETSEKVGKKPLAVWIQEEIDDLIMDNPHPAKAFAKGQKFAYNRVLERLENENDPS